MKRAGTMAMALLVTLFSGCGEDRLIHSVMGILQLKVISVGAEATAIDLTLRCSADSRDARAAIATRDLTLIKVEDLSPGTCEARVVARAANNQALRSVWVSQVLITRGKTTEITVDMADLTVPPQPVELCDGIDNNGDGIADEPKQLAVCAQCQNNIEVLAADDDRCPVVGCSAFFGYQLRGSPDNGWTCVKSYMADIETNRCVAIGVCLENTEKTCQDKGTKMEELGVSIDAADLCHEVDGCTDQTAGTVGNKQDGTTCGDHKWCQAGVCACKPYCDGKACGDNGCGGSCGPCSGTDQCTAGVCVATGPEAGCADGTREGFATLATFPTIAACSGAWDQPGITEAISPTCNRASGNDGTNKEGTGCSAADLCAVGWHICLGKTEVAAKAGATACQTEWPTQDDDTGVLFAVVQHSSVQTTCDDASLLYNDVYGCGSTGHSLSDATNHCGVLNRALASTANNSCGWAQAEGTNGPWRCTGVSTNEGGDVIKNGCPNTSCSSGGHPIANWDKGGVLCCKD